MPDATHRVPAVDQLVEVHQALWGFLNEGEVRLASHQYGELYGDFCRPACVSEQEDKLLAPFGRLVDALHPVLPLLGRFEGWPPVVGRSLRVIAEKFDAVTRAWRWEELTRPEPERSSYVARRNAWFREDVERPFFEAA